MLDLKISTAVPLFREPRSQFPVPGGWFPAVHSSARAPCTDASPRTASPGLTKAPPGGKKRLYHY